MDKASRGRLRTRVRRDQVELGSSLADPITRLPNVHGKNCRSLRNDVCRSERRQRRRVRKKIVARPMALYRAPVRLKAIDARISEAAIKTLTLAPCGQSCS